MNRKVHKKLPNDRDLVLQQAPLLMKRRCGLEEKRSRDEQGLRCARGSSCLPSTTVVI